VGRIDIRRMPKTQAELAVLVNGSTEKALALR